MVLTDDSGWRAFISFMQDFFSYEYSELSKEYKDKVIEEILINNVDYISKEEVMSHQDMCNRCGQCCRELSCRFFNYDTNLCTRHDNQLMDLCREYPWGGEYGIQPLSLNCMYKKRFFLKWFSDYFKKVIEMKEGDNNE